jgi:hypothetical protein
VSSARGSRASLIGRLRSGSIVSALNGQVARLLEYPAWHK